MPKNSPLIARRRLLGQSATRGRCWLAACALLMLCAPPAGGQDPCPEVQPQARKCPWTPEGHTVHPCGPGFCWDGGPQGALACKQEANVSNAHRTGLNDLVCDDGYEEVRDRCTNVVTRCRSKGGGWISWLLPAGGTQRIRDSWDSTTARDAGIIERALGGLSLLGAGAETFLLLTGIFGVGRWLLGRLAAKLGWGAAAKAAANPAFNTARKMAIYEGEQFGHAVAKMSVDPLSAAGTQALEKMVEHSAPRIAGQLVEMVGAEAAKKMTRDQMAGAVFSVLEHNGPLSPAVRESVFTMLQNYFQRGIQYLDASGRWVFLR
jgi:hypothetical protein